MVQVWYHHDASVVDAREPARDEMTRIPQAASAGGAHGGNGFPLVSGPAKGVMINPTM
jgi:hypothetical protein